MFSQIYFLFNYNQKEKYPLVCSSNHLMMTDTYVLHKQTVFQFLCAELLSFGNFLIFIDVKLYSHSMLSSIYFLMKFVLTNSHNRILRFISFINVEYSAIH